MGGWPDSLAIVQAEGCAINGCNCKGSDIDSRLQWDCHRLERASRRKYIGGSSVRVAVVSLLIFVDRVCVPGIGRREGLYQEQIGNKPWGFRQTVRKIRKIERNADLSDGIWKPKMGRKSTPENRKRDQASEKENGNGHAGYDSSTKRR